MITVFIPVVSANISGGDDMANMVKVCKCGCVNPANGRECEDCGASLIRIQPTYAEANTDSTDGVSERPGVAKVILPSAPKSEVKPASPVSPSSGSPMRKCAKCGRLMPYSFSKCACGEPMFGPPIMKVMEEPLAVAPPLSYYLRSEDGRYHLELKNDSDITLGRAAEASDYLSGKAYVSREHARIAVKAGNIILYNLSKTNPTLVNGKPIDQDSPFPLNDKDLIALGAQPEQSSEENAAYFRIIKKST